LCPEPGIRFMTTAKNNLHRQLIDAYSDANLNKITAGLLDLYRSHQHGKLRELARRVSDIIPIDDGKISKCFSQLVMLYHPDRGEAHRREIESLVASGKTRELHRFSHILTLGDFDDLPSASSAPDSSDFVTEYSWDEEDVDRRPARDWVDRTFEDEQFEETGEEFENTFFQAVKLKFYGTLDVELPYYYLEDFDEIEMAECGIVSLDGVEYCIHASVVDISGNAISDISDLHGLVRISELYASGNSIGYVDVLSSLVNLRIVDLSMNEIDDLSPLCALEHLEFVNVVGNPVPEEQIEKLRAMGCTVLC
jgi:Leucine-rich repeat (LRR) protein